MKAKRTKKSSLRDELIETSIVFLHDHSADELTMRKIAELCHVTPHAIYNHFENKDALLTAVSDNILRRITNLAIEVLTRDSTGFAEKMTRFSEIYLDLMEKYPYHAAMLNAKKPGESTPYYEIERKDGRLVYRGKYPGFPTLKTLDRICTLPPIALKGLLKLGQMAERLKKPSSEIAPREDDPAVAHGQIMLFCFISGLQSELHSGTIPEQNRHETILALLETLFRYIL